MPERVQRRSRVNAGLARIGAEKLIDVAGVERLRAMLFSLLALNHRREQGITSLDGVFPATGDQIRINRAHTFRHTLLCPAFPAMAFRRKVEYPLLAAIQFHLL